MILVGYSPVLVPDAVTSWAYFFSVVRDVDPDLIDYPAVYLAQAPSGRRLSCSINQRANTVWVELCNSDHGAVVTLLELFIRFAPLKARSRELSSSLKVLKIYLYPNPIARIRGGGPYFRALP